MIVDSHGRSFRNLRVSLTAACNFACTYCVPNGKRLQPASYELSSDELLVLINLLIRVANLEKIRFTGGEPLLSPKFDEIFKEVMRIPELDISLTTNGQLIPQKIKTLVDSGLKRINISLDTLDPTGFRSIARGGDLNAVLNGIELLLEAGISIKINMVPMKGVNDDQIVPLLNYCLGNGIELRFIELMNMGHLRQGNQYGQSFISQEEILNVISSKYEYLRTDAPFDSTAVRYEIPEEGIFGIIANESEPFCSSCTRLRLSSNGLLYGCLSNSSNLDLKPLVELPDKTASEMLAAMLEEALLHKQDVYFTGDVTVMKFIGG